jgi:hypothetical protein
MRKVQQINKKKGRALHFKVLDHKLPNKDPKAQENQRQKKTNTKQKIDQGVCGITWSLVSKRFASHIVKLIKNKNKIFHDELHDLCNMLFLDTKHVCSATTTHTFYGALDCLNPNLKIQSLNEFFLTFYSFFIHNHLLMKS